MQNTVKTASVNFIIANAENSRQLLKQLNVLNVLILRLARYVENPLFQNPTKLYAAQQNVKRNVDVN